MKGTFFFFLFWLQHLSTSSPVRHDVDVYSNEVERFDFNGKPTDCLKTHSQDWEELVVRRAFRFDKKWNGTYVEIGALDGESFSNTALLATCQGWTGLLVEGSAENFAQLKVKVPQQGRPNVTAYNGAVCAPPRENVLFSQGGGPVAGDLNLMADSFKKQFQVAQRGDGVTVPCRPMSYFLSGFPHVDFFSLDVEGAELEVIETIDFTATQIDVFLIEFDGHNLEKNWKIMRVMLNLGYLECKNNRVRMRSHRRSAVPATTSKIFVRSSSGMHC